MSIEFKPYPSPMLDGRVCRVAPMGRKLFISACRGWPVPGPVAKTAEAEPETAKKETAQ